MERSTKIRKRMSNIYIDLDTTKIKKKIDKSL